MLIVTSFLSAGLGSCSKKGEPRPGIILFVDGSRPGVERLYALSPEGELFFQETEFPGYQRTQWYTLCSPRRDDVAKFAAPWRTDDSEVTHTGVWFSRIVFSPEGELKKGDDFYNEDLRLEEWLAGLHKDVLARGHVVDAPPTWLTKHPKAAALFGPPVVPDADL